jgi:chromosome segregation ATPase
MTQFAKDFGRGLLLAVPLLAFAALGAREVLRLREETRRLEAARADAEQRATVAEQRLASQLRRVDEAFAARLRNAADAAESQGAAEERLTQVIEFLKSEVSTAESTIRGLQGRPGTGAATGADRTSQLLSEISRLNGEIEDLRAERDRLKRGQRPP